MKRVVITGIGSISPVGLTAESTWQAIVAGKSGLGLITQFDASRLPVKHAAEIQDFDPVTILPKREVRRQDRFELLGFAAAKEAIENSELNITEENSPRIGTAISSASGGFITFREQLEILIPDGPSRMSPFTIPKVMSNGASGMVSIMYGIRGPAFSVASACASGSDGIGMAYNLIKAGTVDAMVAGGAEAAIHELAVGAFAKVQAYSSRTANTPSPFSADRDGLIIGEGAAVVVLESLERAKARGANILAEVAGYGASADAFHITAPTEDGRGSGAAIQTALADAEINPDEVDYINAHGTGTPLNDVSETRAIKYALDENAYNIPVSSTKSMTGHMMGATGAVEAVFLVQAIRDHIVPPTINYHEPDPECDLDYIPNEAREIEVNIAMSNAFGFGGHNSVLIIRRYNGD